MVGWRVKVGLGVRVRVAVGGPGGRTVRPAETNSVGDAGKEVAGPTGGDVVD
jgi:hypothetical protein